MSRRPPRRDRPPATVARAGHRAFRRAALKLAVFVVASVFITAMVVATLLNQTTSATTTYHAVVDDATGLQTGDTVRIAGVQVGQVTAVGLVGDRARVTFTVDRADPLPRTVHADIRFADLLGQRFLALDPGSGGTDTAPGHRLAPGATIPVSRTSPSLDLTQVFDGFQPLFNALQPGQVNQLAGEIIAVLQGQSGTITSLVSNTATVVTNLAARQQILVQVIDNLTTLLSAVGSHDQQVGQLIDGLDQVVTGLAGDRDQIATAITGVGGLETTVSGLLTQSQPALNQDISGLATSTAALAANQSGIDSVLSGLPPLLSALDRISDTGNYLNVYLCNLTLNVQGTLDVLQAPVTFPSGPVGDQSQHTAVCQ